MVIIFLLALLKSTFTRLFKRRPPPSPFEFSEFLEATQRDLSDEEKKVVFDLRYYIRLAGLDMMEHIITTEDGFNIVLQHIFDPRESQDDRSRRYPVLMQHGLLQSSAAFCTSGNDQSLAIFLFKEGYDVWLGNNRWGFNPSHKIYSRFDIRMWQWGIKEMGSKDVYAMIDFILTRVSSTSQAKKVAYIGHSQGTSLSVLCLDKRL